MEMNFQYNIYKYRWKTQVKLILVTPLLCAPTVSLLVSSNIVSLSTVHISEIISFLQF